MKTFVVNGVEVDYDVFDLVNLELFDNARTELAQWAREREGSARENPGSGLELLREECERIMDFFDLVVGEGTSERCFGARPNIRILTESMVRFVQEVLDEVRAFRVPELAGPEPGPAPAPGPNREQRRAAERARKRREAEEKLRRRAREPHRGADGAQGEAPVTGEAGQAADLPSVAPGRDGP